MSEFEPLVVCKNCSSEVSPYVTECPYCGQRVRKRAPKIERHGEDGEPAEPRKPRKPRLPRLRRDEIPGIAPDVRPVVTAGLVLLSLLSLVVWSTREVNLDDMGALLVAPDGDWWRLVSTPFIHENLGYAFVALLAVGIFGTALERTFGPLVPVCTFLAAGAGGAALATALDDLPAIGANGAALGLLTAWLVENRLAARRGVDREGDLLGVAVIGILLLLLPLAETSASISAGAGGALAGALAGLVLAVFRR